jgi:hypothetical protein
MTTSTYRESAKIYQFPSRGRAALSGQHEAAVPAVDNLPPALPNAIYGSNWYHDVAIQTADRASKR